MFNGDYIEENGIAESRSNALETLCNTLYERGSLSDIEKFKAAVIKRESEASCELAPNVFVPHAKSNSVVKPSIAFMKTKAGESVYLIASNSDEGHINALSELSKKLLKDE